jgi:hypothetical protein
VVVNESDGPSGAFTRLRMDLSRFFEIGFWVMREGSDWRGQIAERERGDDKVRSGCCFNGWSMDHDARLVSPSFRFEYDQRQANGSNGYY